MNYYIKEEINGVAVSAHVSTLDRTYKYFQITPETGFPFFIRYDAASKKWRTAAEIYKTDPKVVELVGKWLNEKLK